MYESAFGPRRESVEGTYQSYQLREKRRCGGLLRSAEKTFYSLKLSHRETDNTFCRGFRGTSSAQTVIARKVLKRVTVSKPKISKPQLPYPISIPN